MARTNAILNASPTCGSKQMKRQRHPRGCLLRATGGEMCVGSRVQSSSVANHTENSSNVRGYGLLAVDFTPPALPLGVNQLPTMLFVRDITGRFCPFPAESSPLCGRFCCITWCARRACWLCRHLPERLDLWWEATTDLLVAFKSRGDRWVLQSSQKKRLKPAWRVPILTVTITASWGRTRTGPWTWGWPGRTGINHLCRGRRCGNYWSDGTARRSATRCSGLP